MAEMLERAATRVARGWGAALSRRRTRATGDADNDASTSSYTSSSGDAYPGRGGFRLVGRLDADTGANAARRAPRTTLSTPPRPLGRARDAGRVSPTRRTASTTRSSRDGGPRRTAAAWRRRTPRRCRARTKTPRRRSALGRRHRTPRGRARRRRLTSPGTRTREGSRRWSRRRGGDAKPPNETTDRRHPRPRAFRLERSFFQRRRETPKRPEA